MALNDAGSRSSRVRTHGPVQLYFTPTSHEDAFRRIRLLDLGDFLQASGTLFTTKTGEKTLRVDHYELLAKTLRPLPAKGAGGDLKLFDPETRHRKRYLDLIANRDVEFPIFIARARVLLDARFPNSHGCLVETPIGEPLYGGATAALHNVPQYAGLRLHLASRRSCTLSADRQRVERVTRSPRNSATRASTATHNPVR
jgi:lysyl-tRNA synthetase class 2